MKERPILFSAPMVRAILEGRKTQTRRVVKQKINPHDFLGGIGDSRNDPYNYGFENPEVMGHFITLPEQRCPFGQVGDQLWVRESFWRWGDYITKTDESGERWTEWHPQDLVGYRADHPEKPESKDGFVARAMPSIHMPRWASRIQLEITGVRVERLQGISEADARAEGIQFECDGRVPEYTERSEFRELWSSINGRESWDANPWVWVVEFQRVKP